MLPNTAHKYSEGAPNDEEYETWKPDCRMFEGPDQHVLADESALG